MPRYPVPGRDDVPPARRAAALLVLIEDRIAEMPAAARVEALRLVAEGCAERAAEVDVRRTGP